MECWKVIENFSGDNAQRVRKVHNTVEDESITNVITFVSISLSHLVKIIKNNDLFKLYFLIKNYKMTSRFWCKLTINYQNRLANLVTTLVVITVKELVPVVVWENM